MMQILIAAGVLGAMGLLFGGLLALAAKKFAVPENPQRDAVREALPGANCGGCGFPGCDGYASAVAEGKAAVNCCPVGGPAVAGKIAEIMGVDAGESVRMVATVRCRGSLDRCNVRFDYEGPKDCRSASLVTEGDKACRYACLGLGNCEKACPFGAIHINENRLAVVDEDKCVGCSVCVNACPRGVLQLMPVNHPVHRTCSAMEKGKVVRDNCLAGCIGCGKCERSCKFGALVLKDNLPQIDLSKCVGCMSCADNCPTGALKSNDALRRRALIHYPACTGCGDCKTACKFDAILGEEGQHHSVIDWNCVGCGACEAACTHGCIQMLPGAKFKK